jgi:hypothetical protein
MYEGVREQKPAQRSDAKRAREEVTALESPIHPILHLQRTLGNRAVQRLLQAQAAARRVTPPSPPVPPHPAHPPVFPPATEGMAFAGQVKWQQPAQFPKALGYTYYHADLIQLWPSFTPVCEPKFGEVTCKLSKTDAIGAEWPSVATPENQQGYLVTPDKTLNPVFQQHVKEDYSHYVRVGGKAANNIAAAEQQHLNDFDLAWEITGEAVAKAINAVADEEPTVRPTKPEAKIALADKVVAKLGTLGTVIRGALESGGRLEKALRPAMDKANQASLAQRDATGKHTPELLYVMTDDQKKAVLFEVDEDFVLDTTPSSKIVNLGTIL